MSAQDFVPLLARHPFSKDMPPRQLERLAALARAVTFAPQQIVFREGDECSEFYLIANGRIALEMEVGTKRLPVQTLSGGEEFGISALIQRRGTHFQVRALQAVDALAFDAAQLLAACRSDAEFGYALMSRLLLIVSERLDATRLLLSDTYSAEAKRAGA